jgi:hypothetical protein
MRSIYSRLALHSAICTLGNFRMVDGGLSLNWAPKLGWGLGLGLGFVSVNCWYNCTSHRVIMHPMLGWASEPWYGRAYKLITMDIVHFCNNNLLMQAVKTIILSLRVWSMWYDYISYLRLQSSTPTPDLSQAWEPYSNSDCPENP